MTYPCSARGGCAQEFKPLSVVIDGESFVSVLFSLNCRGTSSLFLMFRFVVFLQIGHIGSFEPLGTEATVLATIANALARPGAGLLMRLQCVPARLLFAAAARKR